MQDLLVIVCKQVGLVRHQHKVPILKPATLTLCMKIQTNRTATAYILPHVLHAGMDVLWVSFSPPSNPHLFPIQSPFSCSVVTVCLCAHVK